MSTHNLSAELTSFVGRASELAELEQLVTIRRMVTLTGVGGSGKTRLARELGARAAGSWRDGFWLVDLGSVGDPTLVGQTAASTLGVLVEPGGEVVRSLAAQLREKRLLLCLDTCEHLLDAAAMLAETVLRECPGVGVLATSREPLAVEGEAVWRVPSMRPDEAEALFADRAMLADPHFDLRPVAHDVDTLCRRVDWIPLAIELAAAWIAALTPAQIAEGLEESLSLLAGGSRRAIARHKTLLASMGWSYALLGDEERVFFRRLAVFVGSFPLDAAATICFSVPADPDHGSVDHTDDTIEDDDRDRSGIELGTAALRLLRRLVDVSLVTVRSSAGSVRYRLLDTVRQYAESRLEDAGETRPVRDRHLAYYLRVAEEAEPGLDVEQDRWRQVLESHRDDISAALHWGLTPSRAVVGRRLAAAMARQWCLRGQSAEALAFLTRAIDLDPEDRSPVQARLLAGMAMVGMVSGDLRLVTDAAQRGLVIATECEDAPTAARCRTMIAYPQFFVDFARCRQLASEGRAAAVAAGDAFARDWATILEGYSLLTRNQRPQAIALARQAFEDSQSRGDRFCAAFARGIDIFLAMYSGDVRAAVAIGEETMQIARPLGDYFALGTLSVNTAQAVALAGDLPRARGILEDIVRSLDTAGRVEVVGWMVPYGLLHLWSGDLEAAAGYFRRGVDRMSDSSAPDWTAARCLPGLASALRRLGHPDEARKWAALGVELCRQFDTPWELASALDELAWLSHADNPDLARELHLEALTFRRVRGLRTGYPDSLDALARLDASSGGDADSERLEEAARLLAVSTGAREEMGYPRPLVDQPDHEQFISRLRSRLGDRFDRAARDGIERGIDDWVAALTRGRGPRDRPATGWASLSPVERDIAQLVSQGLSNPEIADRLYMSRSTVKAHLSHIFGKLNLANRVELAAATTTQDAAQLDDEGPDDVPAPAASDPPRDN